jgi:hypothetical protein
MSLVRQNPFQTKVRLLLSATGVAPWVMLILVLNGFSSGVYAQATAYFREHLQDPPEIRDRVLTS